MTTQTGDFMYFSIMHTPTEPRLTLTVDATRLKLNGTHNERLHAFAEYIDQYTRSNNMILQTMRGRFQLKNEKYRIILLAGSAKTTLIFEEGVEGHKLPFVDKLLEATS
jgi:hypothetical protein